MSLSPGRADQVAPLAEKSATDAVSKAFRNAKPLEKNVLSAAKSARPRKGKLTEDILAGLKDDDVLLDIGGKIQLKWGLLRRHVEALCGNIDRPDMQAAGNNAVKTMAFQTYCRKLLKDYIEYGVFAFEARRLGIVVGEDEFRKYRQRAREGYAHKGDVGRALLKLMDAGESFYEHNLTNALYCKAYRAREIEPKIELPDEDVRKFMDMRHEKNLRVLATNEFKRVQIGKILAELRGGMDFGEAAEKWSDDDSSMTKGIMMDDQGETTLKFEKDDLDGRIADRCWNIREGELSEVIETPYAWHVVKLLKRNPATADDAETIEFAQIKLEKEFIDPEFSEEEARDKARALILRSAMTSKFAELMKKTHIDSKIPISDSGKRGKSGTRIRRIR